MKRQNLPMLLVLVLFVGPRCAHIPRSGDRTVMTGAAHAGRSEDIARGCEGELLSAESHDLVGGSLTVDHDGKSGVGGGGGINIGRGEVVAATIDGNNVTAPPHMFGSASGFLSYDAKLVGFDLGASLMLAGGEVIAAPTGTLKFGAIDHVWGELAIGPHDGYFDGEMVGLHLAGRSDDFSLRLGFGGYGRPLLLRDKGLMFGIDDMSLWPGVRFDFSVAVNDCWAIAGGFVGSETWSGWLGVQRTFGEARR